VELHLKADAEIIACCLPSPRASSIWLQLPFTFEWRNCKGSERFAHRD
jgi:hypothetical protein